MNGFLQTYGKEIVSVVVPFIVWALNFFFRAKAKLLLATPHGFTFLVQQPLHDAEGKEVASTQTVATRSLIISNSGRVPATRVELVFNWKPLCMNVWPPRHFEEHTEPDNRYTLIFESLAPGEHFGCELLAVNGEVPNLVTVRCDECVAEPVEMYPQPHVSNWKRRLAAVLLFFGSVALIYGAIVLLQFIILKTPLGH